MARSASKLFTCPSVAFLISIYKHNPILSYIHNLVKLVAWCLVKPRPLGQRPLLFQTWPQIPVWQALAEIRAQGRGYCVGDPSPRSVEGRSQSWRYNPYYKLRFRNSSPVRLWPQIHRAQLISFTVLCLLEPHTIASNPIGSGLKLVLCIS